jgi:hypothetical protein
MDESTPLIPITEGTTRGLGWSLGLRRALPLSHWPKELQRGHWFLVLGERGAAVGVTALAMVGVVNSLPIPVTACRGRLRGPGEEPEEQCFLFGEAGADVTAVEWSSAGTARTYRASTVAVPGTASSRAYVIPLDEDGRSGGELAAFCGDGASTWTTHVQEEVDGAGVRQLLQGLDEVPNLPN